MLVAPGFSGKFAPFKNRSIVVFYVPTIYAASGDDVIVIDAEWVYRSLYR